MKIYKIEESGSRTMGFACYEKYYQHKADALKAFDEKIKGYRKSKELAKKSDLDGENPIKIEKDAEKLRGEAIAEAWIAVWDRYDIPEEGTEWDIGSMRVQVIEIEVEEGDNH
ncbi:hypothetical protein MHH60_29775 [Paenibacillus sp. FSL H7-0716]|uniref:Uncharacterized protein n=1 Tax=Paenibacillus odorifer TaxID=189426 RepID=A0AB36J8S2_9BACL|nr:hypothetical protein [Paenibacillus odorifer]OME11059.1 hypothetical protein BSK47_29570 [Paenibacillus odorifer]